MTSFQVGGYRPSTVIDFEVPKRYGLRQTIADTLGVGGIMRGLRTIPVLLDVCRDMEELSPDALLLKYVNPMAMLCWAVAEAQHDPHRGALPLRPAHGGRARRRPRAAGRGGALPRRGHQPRRVLPARSSTTARTSTRRCACSTPPDGNRVRYELMRHFGSFVTESSEHFAEYVPWFIKAARGPDRALRHPARRVPAPLRAQIAEWEALRDELERGGASAPGAATSTARDIIRACETGEPFAFNGNVPNRHGGRPADRQPADDCCVEVPCVAGAGGIVPRPVGALPRHLAALMQTNVNVQGLTVEAALTGRREAVHQAAMLDPHTGGELSLDEIRELVDDLLEAHGEMDPAVRRRAARPRGLTRGSVLNRTTARPWLGEDEAGARSGGRRTTRAEPEHRSTP